MLPISDLLAQEPGASLANDFDNAIIVQIGRCEHSNAVIKLDGARTRRHTIGLIPVSQNLTWRIASASAARFSVGTRGFGRRFMPPDYCLSASPPPDTPEILMLSG